MSETQERPSSTSLRAALLVSGLAVCAYIVPFLDFVPVWDSMEFARCVARGSEAPFWLRTKVCAGHPTFSFAFISGLFFRFLGGAPGLVLYGLCVALIAVAAFHEVATRIFGARVSPVEVWMITLLFASNPVFLANTVNFGMDATLTAGFLASLWCFLHRRFVCAFVVGVLLATTKETGLPLYLVSALVCIRSWRAGPAGREGLSAREKKLLLFVVGAPVLACVVGILVQYLVTKHIYLFGAKPLVLHADDAFDPTLRPSDWKPAILLARAALLTTLFVLNSHWLQTIVVAAALIVAAFGAARPSTGRRELLTVCGLLACVLAVTLPVAPFTNPRYLLPAHPLLHLAALGGLVHLVRAARPRVLLLSVLVLGEILSVHATRDPVSRALFGTFRFGGAEMLRMTSLTDEQFGSGRDQLAYNLEFLAFHYLGEAAAAGIGNRGPVNIPKYAEFHVMGPFSTQDRRRVVSYADEFRFGGHSTGGVLRHLPERVLRVEFPNVTDSAATEAELYARYASTAAWTYYWGPYSLTVKQLKRIVPKHAEAR